MAGPLVIGVGAILLFNVVDTIFVGQLGVRPLAAMSFTFPVIMMMINLVVGIGTGVTASISQAIGRGDDSVARYRATDALIMSVGIAGTLCGLGLYFHDSIFLAVGADADLLPLIRSYMVPYFFGLFGLIIPITGNCAIRGTGDTTSPSVIMLISGCVNLVLDPFLIFGWGPFPRLELAGAAIATVIAWTVSLTASLVIQYRLKLLLFARRSVGSILRSWKDILHAGLPTAATNILMPAATALLTRLVSSHGAAANAAYGIGHRVEAVAMVGLFALSMAVTAFVGQNYGAKQISRIDTTLDFSVKVCLLWSTAVAGSIWLARGPLTALFNDDPDVVNNATTFLQIIPWSYGALGLSFACTATLNALGRPLLSSVVVCSRLFLFTIPLAIVGDHHFGLSGLFAGIAVGNLLTGAVAFVIAKQCVRRLQRAAPAGIEEARADAD